MLCTYLVIPLAPLLTRWPPSVVCTVNDCNGEIASPKGCFEALFSNSRIWSSRANGHLKLIARYPTLGLTSNRDALNQAFVTANYVPNAFIGRDLSEGCKGI